ncbi:LacI family DNA-binding transcriptional regulator [Catenulispora sp. NF23]|uniref:LacI family DNA-binding transcriptional regulator n=1 Tax=Catenulispora pinistramenti TaxID=2705254 RepID=A0ABS5KIZ4_9ACTN|nr:LacI family DNA-binding transcriptional regulator [Catenulispora pinistramenti]MBS2532593.1 LacI family DNA-binding transcriptional regulator [Catenulispora pinistramenti]MBS2546299.1 LacI family DNA-binding transcriptional regulator [Catenulispora pinistramenti]
MRSVAEHAGVSHQTVSRVVNGDPTVTDPVRQRVVTSMSALGYRPSAGGRAMARGRTEVVGLVIPHDPGFAFANDHLIRMMTGAEQELAARGYGLLLSTREASGDPGSPYRRFDRRRLVDGLIVEGGGGTAALPHLVELGYPVVVIGYTEDDLAMVHPDDEGGAYAVAQHLLALGHRRIGVVNGPQENRLAMAARLRGVHRAFADARLEPDPGLTVHGDFTFESGHAAARQLMARSEPPTAVFAFNDGMALGVLRFLRESGRGVPGDVSVAGFDDTSAAVLGETPLTSVALQSVDLGRRAAQILLDLLDGKTAPNGETVMAGRLMVRASTAPPPAGTS